MSIKYEDNLEYQCGDGSGKGSGYGHYNAGLGGRYKTEDPMNITGGAVGTEPKSGYGNGFGSGSGFKNDSGNGKGHGHGWGNILCEGHVII